MPQFKVNKTDAIIPNLDAQFAGGFTGNQMANFGGDGFTTSQTTFHLLTMAAETDPLPAGTYYVTATAWLDMPPDDVGGTCWIAKCSDPSTAINSAPKTGPARSPSPQRPSPA